MRANKTDKTEQDTCSSHSVLPESKSPHGFNAPTRQKDSFWANSLYIGLINFGKPILNIFLYTEFSKYLSFCLVGRINLELVRLFSKTEGHWHLSCPVLSVLFAFAQPQGN